MKFVLTIITMMVVLVGCGGGEGGGQKPGQRYACTWETQQVDPPFEWSQNCINVDSKSVCEKLARTGTYRNVEFHPGYVCK